MAYLYAIEEVCCNSSDFIVKQRRKSATIKNSWWPKGSVKSSVARSDVAITWNSCRKPAKNYKDMAAVAILIPPKKCGRSSVAGRIMAALAPRGRAPSLQAGTYSSLPSAAVPSASQVGSQADPLRLGDVVLLYAQDKKSYVFSDISRCVQLDK